MRVSLLAPLTTKFNRKGDIVSAKVLDPARLQGGILEGEIREVHAGGGATKPSAIQFQFHTLHFSGSALPISVNLQAISNSKNKKGCDEDGVSLETDQNAESTGKRSIAAAVRGIGRERKTPSQTGLIRLSGRSEHLALAVGSELLLQVSAREQ